MSTPSPDPRHERVLSLALPAADAELIATVLRQVGLTFEVCPTIKELCQGIRAGAGSAVLAEEALEQANLQRLVEVIDAQDAWSDFPLVVFFSSTGQTTEMSLRMLSLLEPLRNITVLERPIRIMSLVSALKSCVRDRRRQYNLRDTLSRLEDNLLNRDRFMALLAHEVRTPLSTIQTATHILHRMGAQTTLAIEQRAVISRQTERLGQLMTDVLDVFRLNSGKVALTREPVDLGALTRTCLQHPKEDPIAKRIQLSYTGTGHPVVVESDAGRLRQVIEHLLANAIRHTPSGGRVAVSVRPEGGKAVLSVSDSGLGVDRATFDRLRTDLADARAQDNARFDGLRIGLRLVQSLVDLLGGELSSTESGQTRGTELVVSLPMPAGPISPPGQGPAASWNVTPAAPAVTPGQAATAASDGPLDGPPARRVLIVEDNADGRETLRLLLQLWGHDVEVADDGSRGVLKARTFRPDVALIDIGLPGLDGFSVAQQLRSTLGCGINLIALTGFGQSQDRFHPEAKGFDAYLLKPVDPAELRRALDAYPGSDTVGE